ncbi:MAG: NAD(P)H-dependent glycerol-3-phosphate dehydrogenase [SAR324 cluster bacterium]|nr:NAD(P)H-dependent glycerol-3-phosphate dehydrogenase [SAR324 cluster bacterium]
MSNDSQLQRITILGAGRWGTAMAIFLSRKGLDVTLQCHLKEEYEQLIKTDSAPNLPGFSCGGKIRFDLDLNRSIAAAQIVIIAIPVAFMRNVLKQIEQLLPDAVLLSINKGIERESLKTVPEVVVEYFPNHSIAHLGGPCFPEGLLSETTPVAETLACENEELGLRLQKTFSSPSFRVYRSFDLKGVALLGALKNIYAIIAGVADGLGMCEEVTSVLVTRGLAEMKRFCQHMNISLDTLYGLSGLGDLALTCYSPKSSHNKNFGKRLGKGETVTEILATMGGTIAEGYFTTKAVWDISQKKQIDLPLCDGIYQVIYNNKSLIESLKSLMTRPLKVED